MKSKELFLEELKQNEKVLRYKKLELIINNNENILKLFDELKKIQQQLINAKNISKENAINVFTMQYNEKLEQLENYPLVSEYLALQSEINDFLQEFTNIIETGITKDLS